MLKNPTVLTRIIFASHIALLFNINCFKMAVISSTARQNLNTEAKRCFATHDEDIDYFNMRIYIILIACVYIQQFNFVQ